MKVRIDREECTMCSICWETCPDFFEQSGKDDLSQVVEEHRTGGNLSEGEVPGSLEDCVREAADGCPVDIIQIED